MITWTLYVPMSMFYPLYAEHVSLYLWVTTYWGEAGNEYD